MKELDGLVQSLSRGSISEIFPTEDVLIQSVQELVRDEIKKYILVKLNENPEIKEEIKDAVKEYIEAKLKELHAALKLTKAGAKLGLNLIPDDMREEVSKSFIQLFEKEISEILSRSL